ncbi:hypothetical protein PAPYR_1327 [Paratrimastix pyriformis]|uniref:DOT1 domain-containing protein n=1 Tax=Paratrimastix pyriformis TaxID=342808 RepID=A0ABQ8USN8_9EUKA|nr:hypothetical protein PAPYR_1327 [Paratrimastix pyriformis]
MASSSPLPCSVPGKIKQVKVSPLIKMMYKLINQAADSAGLGGAMDLSTLKGDGISILRPTDPEHPHPTRRQTRNSGLTPPPSPIPRGSPVKPHHHHHHSPKIQTSADVPAVTSPLPPTETIPPTPTPASPPAQRCVPGHRKSHPERCVADPFAWLSPATQLAPDATSSPLPPDAPPGRSRGLRELASLCPTDLIGNLELERQKARRAASTTPAEPSDSEPLKRPRRAKKTAPRSPAPPSPSPSPSTLPSPAVAVGSPRPRSGTPATQDVGANSIGYGEQTQGSCQKMLDQLMRLPEPYRLGPQSCFLDIGSGLGKVVFHAALVCAPRRSVGIEIVQKRHDFARALMDMVAELIFCGTGGLEGQYTVNPLTASTRPRRRPPASPAAVPPAVSVAASPAALPAASPAAPPAPAPAESSPRPVPASSLPQESITLMGLGTFPLSTPAPRPSSPPACSPTTGPASPPLPAPTAATTSAPTTSPAPTPDGTCSSSAEQEALVARFRAATELFAGDATDFLAKSAPDAFTHIYLFDKVFAPETYAHLCPVLRRMRFRVLVSFKDPRYIRKWGLRLRAIQKVFVHTTGGQSFTGWVYVPLGSGEREAERDEEDDEDDEEGSEGEDGDEDDEEN